MEKYKLIRGKIEVFFKLCKSGLSLKKLPQIYTRISQYINLIFSKTLHNKIAKIPKQPIQKLSNT